MATRPTVTARIAISFTVDPDTAPQNQPIHDALKSARALEIEAPSLEIAELHASLLVRALERAGN
jgi:hypothetical protein